MEVSVSSQNSLQNSTLARRITWDIFLARKSGSIIYLVLLMNDMAALPNECADKANPVCCCCCCDTTEVEEEECVVLEMVLLAVVATPANELDVPLEEHGTLLLDVVDEGGVEARGGDPLELVNISKPSLYEVNAIEHANIGSCSDSQN